jgi:hypothetical protein
MSRHPEDWDLWIAEQESSGPALPATLLEIERWLRRLPDGSRTKAAALANGLGDRLPSIAARFEDFTTVAHVHCLGAFSGELDVVVAIDAIAAPRLADFDAALEVVCQSLVEGGLLLATFPAAPKRTILRAMLLDHGDDTPAPVAFHEIELQYRLQRAGLRGTVMRRIADDGGRESLVCRVVRRADN